MIILTFVSFSLLAVFTQASSPSLKVSVYYESLCPYSKQFMVNQFKPTYEILSAYLTVEFVPFGNAHITTSEDGTPIFTCQHGSEECHGNEVQACVISTNPENSLDFVECAMTSNDASDDAILEQCADSSEISWDSVNECIASGLGDELLVKYGNATEALKPDYYGTPSIAYNDVFNKDVSLKSIGNFFEVVCFFLMKPKECEEAVKSL